MSVTPAETRRLHDRGADRRLHDGLQGLREQVEAASVVPRQAKREAREETDRRARRFWLPLVLVAAVASSAATAIGTYFWLAPQINELRTEQTATRAAADEVRRIADEAAADAAAANAELASRGQEQVPVPAPGEASDSEVLVAAATARVLASLPDSQPVTAGAIAAEVANYLTRNPPTPVGPTMGQIADAVAAYLQANPPPRGQDGQDGRNGDDGADGRDGVTPPCMSEPNQCRGEDGEDGQDGPPPTAEEIRAALDAYFVDNPIPPCPPGTSLQPVQFGVAGPEGVGCVNDQ
jgi:hypothetical protein